VGRIFKV